MYSSAFRSDCLSGKCALLTGGGSGITFSIAEAMIRHGAKVAILSRNMQRLLEAKQKLDSIVPGKCIAVQADVRNEEEIKKAVAQVVKEFGCIDILVNGAAGNFLAPAEKISARGFRTVMEIDAVGTFLVTQEVFKQTMKMRKSGVIINITATLHWNGELLQTHAGAAKAAIEAMTKHLANEWGKFGIRVNNIAPGPIEGTEGFDRLGGDLFLKDSAKEYSLKEDVIESIALRRFGEKNDIAQSAIYLSTDASSYVTGTTLVVDGGAWFFSGGKIGRQVEKMMLAKSKM
jgi:2,4-dienoyl-CoA reductase [(3E)-enoyl-CoA-producing], peroxisomal